ncbi:Metallophos domain-containing protein [Mycena kentingensis (nom. inval.)]|nr:Metallophos domain-containing protein [Mycena kentingensis (nom. inval.)]
MGVSSRRKAARSTRLSRTLSRTLVNNSLRLAWIVVLVYGEVGVYYWSVSTCKWPERTEWRRGKPSHVLLISDPQVRHPLQRSAMRNLGQFLYEIRYDLNLKRAWHVTRRLNPHAVFFLGDQLSSGKFVRSEAEYGSYWRKFQEIFRPAASVPHYYIPGNNDVGMGLSHSSPKNVRLYYSNVVGPFNREIVIRDHVFVALDAPGLVDDDYQRSGTPYHVWTPARGGTVEFVKSIVSDGRPTILLSHIPMARPDTASCGPLREKGSIRRGVGHGYQNTLGKHTTAFLFKTLQPAAIFSGDNRDYCEYNHPADADEAQERETSTTIREVSIKSFSMSVHIERPGFQLVSLVDPTPSGKSIADAPCLLPDTDRIYNALYVPLAVLTVILLLGFNVYRSRRLRNIPLAPIALSPMGNGALSPHNLPWSPFTPPVPVSPRHGLPPTLRTPTTSNALPGPTMRASRPGTPTLVGSSSSPMLAPAIVFQPEEDEDDALYPAQYAIQRNGHIDGDHEDWPAPRDDPAPSFFLPAPGNPKLTLPSASSPAWSWSWTFVLGGRRRRMTLSAPTWSSVRDLAGLLAPGGDSDMVLRRRGVLWATGMDVFAVLWSTVVVWVVFAWLAI